MKLTDTVAKAHGMNGETWKRHANPWSVWTRFAAIPVFELAVWSRDWIGWWSLAGVAVVLVWLFYFNVRIFGPVEPTSWAARGIYGERLHVEGETATTHQGILRLLIAVGVASSVFLVWGLVALNIWPLILGTTVLIMAQLWRIDRYSLLFEQHHGQSN